MRCCIMVPTKNRIATPIVISVVLFVLTHWATLRPRGEISTISATMCSHAKGNVSVVLPME